MSSPAQNHYGWLACEERGQMKENPQGKDSGGFKMIFQGYVWECFLLKKPRKTQGKTNKNKDTTKENIGSPIFFDMFPSFSFNLAPEPPRLVGL